MRRLVFAELVVLAAAASVALLLLTVHCCRRGWSSSSKRPTEPLPVSEPPRQLPGATKERRLEPLRRALLRLCSHRSRVEPAATSPDAQGEAVPAQLAQAAVPVLHSIPAATRKQSRAGAALIPMRRLVFAKLVVLAAAASVALLLLTVHCCRRGWSSSSKRPTEPLPVSEPPRQLLGATKERRLEPLRRALLRLCSRRSRVEPAATSPDAQGEAVPAQLAQAAVPVPPEEEVAAWRDRWFGGPAGSRALYTIDEESSTLSWTPMAASERDDCESQCGGERQEPETTFYTPAASPQHEAAEIS